MCKTATTYSNLSIVGDMQYSPDGFRSYFEGMPVALPNGQELVCNISCLYLESALFVVVETQVSLHGTRLTRFRHSVMSHTINLLKVPASKFQFVTYIERYTHVPNEQWLMVSLSTTTPMEISSVQSELRQRLQSELLNKR